RGTDKHIEIQSILKQNFLDTCGSLQPMIALELTTRAENLLETDLPEQCSLVIGSERHGISAEILDKCQRAVFIPMYGINGSMNVTHSLAIALYEWRKQHTG
ncbi:MAG TPA: TrmH family RNA methyltransferase, partial [Gammaproteobacteria bacterium]